MHKDSRELAKPGFLMLRLVWQAHLCRLAGVTQNVMAEIIEMKKVSIRSVLLALILVAALSGQGLYAQANRFIRLQDPVYSDIQYLQHQGYLKELHPTALPYRHKEVRRAYRQARKRSTGKRLSYEESSALKRIERYLEQTGSLHSAESGKTSDKRNVAAGWKAEIGLRAANSERLDVLRPLGEESIWPNARLGGYLEYEQWIARANLSFDYYYDTDPDGLDRARRLYTRSEESYLGFNSDFVSLYAGRFTQHWAPYESEGVMLTGNPGAMDQLSLRLGTDKLALRFILAELDNLAPDGTFTSTQDRFEEGSIRRYLYLHRFDWKPNNQLMISLVEGVLYSAEHAGPSLTYANPLHIAGFVTDNTPKNYENNLILGGIFWGYWNGWTLEGQLMLDDLSYRNRSFFKERDDLEPVSMAATGSLTNSRLIAPYTLTLSMEMASSQAYRTDQTEGQWSYAQRGLATNFSDYLKLQLSARWQAHQLYTGLTVKPKLDWLYQGEGDLRLPLDTSSGPVLGIGTPEQTLRPGVELLYQSRDNYWLRLDWGLSHVRNNGHISGNDDWQMIGLIEAGFAIGGRSTLDL